MTVSPRAFVAGFLISAATVVGAIVFLPADTFPVVLDAPASIAAGEIAVLDVTKTEADSYAYSVTPPAVCHAFEGGTKLVFASGTSGDYVFVIAAAKGGQVSIAEHVVTVVGGVDPGPPSPDSGTFAERLRRAVALVKDEAKAEHLASLAGTFKTVASMIGAGVLTDVDEIVTATANLNTEALGDAHAAWQPVRDLLNAEMSARAEAGTLESVEQHRLAWLEIAQLLGEK